MIEKLTKCVSWLGSRTLSTVMTVAFLGILLTLYIHYRAGKPELSIQFDPEMRKVAVINKGEDTVVIDSWHIIYAHGHPEKHPHPIVDTSNRKVETWIPPGNILVSILSETLLEILSEVYELSDLHVLIKITAKNNNIPILTHEYFARATYREKLGKWGTAGVFEDKWKQFFQIQNVRELSEDEIKKLKRQGASEFFDPHAGESSRSE